MGPVSSSQAASSGASNSMEAGFGWNSSGFSVNYGNTTPWYVWAAIAAAGYLLWKSKI